MCSVPGRYRGTIKVSSCFIRGTDGTGYKTLADNLQEFDKINSLPARLKLSGLDDGVGIEVNLHHHKTKWHDPCELQFSKMRRAQMRKSAGEDCQASSNKLTSQSTVTVADCAGRPSRTRDLSLGRRVRYQFTTEVTSLARPVDALPAQRHSATFSPAKSVFVLEHQAQSAPSGF